MVYSIIVFVISVLFGAGMLISGANSNKIKRKYEFLREVIAEVKSDKIEEKERKKQEELYQQKLQASGVSAVVQGSRALDTGLKKASGVMITPGVHVEPSKLIDSTRI